MTSRPVPVQGIVGKTAELKDGFTYRFAGDSPGMNAHASEHAGPVNYGDAFARLCRSDGAFLARWATTNHNKVVFGRAHAADLKSGMPVVEVAIGLVEPLLRE